MLLYMHKVAAMARIKSLFFLLLLFVTLNDIEDCNATDNKDPQVNTPLGRVKGSLMTSRLGKPIFSFRGVKYAKNPERFKPSEPIAPWNDVFDASEEGPACFQLSASTGKNMAEDCLALNIYTTKLPTGDEKVKRPVLVFFHPGAFYFFSGQSYVFGSQYLLDQEIVLVTVNYRLAAFGWISTGDHRAPGNLGMKDQVVALKFIRDNIASFGGDPNSVTISGDSAGAWSTVLHMLSPMSRGLFHRAIVMSGAPTVPDLLPNNQLHLAKKQATFLNCTTEDLDQMMACLKEKPAEEFHKSRPKFAEYHGDPVLIWSPVVEPEIPGVERFLPGQPEDLIREKKFTAVPVMTGITRDEFAGVITIPLNAIKKGLENASRFDQVNENWETISPISFQYERGTERSKRITNELRNFYFKDEPIGLKNINALGWLYADAHVGYPVERFAKLMAANSQEPIYYYEFAYQGRYSFYTWADTKKPFGVGHHDDLQYLFYMAFIFPYFEKDAPEIPTVEKMTAIWTHFAKTGTPIPKNNPLLGLCQDVVWEPLTPQNNKYLEINEQCTMKSDLYGDRYRTWDRIFPLKPLPL